MPDNPKPPSAVEMQANHVTATFKAFVREHGTKAGRTLALRLYREANEHDD